MNMKCSLMQAHFTLRACSQATGEEDYVKNINNMNEAFERQFCSGCLGPQITTKIGFTDKKCCSITLISSIATYFTI